MTGRDQALRANSRDVEACGLSDRGRPEVVANPGLLDAVVLGLGAPRSAAWSRQGASPTLILETDTRN